MFKSTISYRDTSRAENRNYMRDAPNAGKERSHLFGHAVAKQALSTVGGAGRPLSNGAMCVAMDTRQNYHIKTQYANRVLDERRDGRILSVLQHGGGFKEGTTTHRAQQMYKGMMAVQNAYADNHYGRESKQLEKLIVRMGDTPVHTGRVGRPTLLKNTINGK